MDEFVMSIHAVKPETEAVIRRQRRASSITSSVIALLVVVLLMVILSLFLLAPRFKETPVIVSYQSSLRDTEEVQERKVSTAVDRKPSAPSSAMAKVIAANTESPLAVPVPDTVITTTSTDFGTGDDFGEGWGSGSGSGDGGGGATFFQQKVKATKVAYVIDYSQSMRGEREKLMRAELRKSVEGLPLAMSYQLIFFAGPTWIAGDEVTMGKGNRSAEVKGKGGTFDWVSAGTAHDWKSKGRKQKAAWLDVSPAKRKKSLDLIATTKLVYGTNWEPALEMALAMDPAPEVIFFMTDGVTGGNAEGLAKSIAGRAKRANIMINTVAMMEPKAEAAMKLLAKGTGGQFTVIEKSGKVREVPLD
jgi:hypothetical protein